MSSVVQKIDLDSPDLEWIGIRFIDPLGRVFRRDGTYYRAIYNDKVPFTNTLLNDGVIGALADKALIPQVLKVDEVDHPKYGLLMTMESAHWEVSAPRFPLNAVKHSAMGWLAINRKLLEHGYGLCDCHYGNYRLFQDGTPKWVDIGSIAPVKNCAGALVQFIDHFMFPLLIMSRKPGYVTNRFKVLKKLGTNAAEAATILGEAFFESLPAEHKACLTEPKKVPRKRLLAVLTAIMKDLTFSDYEAKWSGYRDKGALDRTLDPEKLFAAASDPRDRIVFETVKSTRPRDILDVGTNNGYHASLVSSLGVDVLGVDTDEFSINEFYKWNRTHKRNVCVSVDNFNTTTHRADTVMSLALTHHLYFTGKLSLAAIADRYATMAKRNLVVEFMANGMGSTVKKPDPLPEGYTLEAFMRELGRHFRTVKHVEYERAPHLSVRRLIHCTDKIA